MNHGPAGLDCLVCRFIGALEQLRDSSWWIQGHHSLRGEIPKNAFFFLLAFVGKTLTLTEKKELEVLPSLHRSLAHVRLLCRWVLTHWSGERGRVNLKKRQKRSAQVDVLCLFFFAALQDCGLLEMSCFSSMVSLMVPLANASWPSHFAFPPWSTMFIFWWFVCFSALPHWFSKKLDEKHKNKGHALSSKEYIFSRPFDHRDTPLGLKRLINVQTRVGPPSSSKRDFPSQGPYGQQLEWAREVRRKIDGQDKRTDTERERESGGRKEGKRVVRGDKFESCSPTFRRLFFFSFVDQEKLGWLGEEWQQEQLHSQQYGKSE